MKRTLLAACGLTLFMAPLCTAALAADNSGPVDISTINGSAIETVTVTAEKRVQREIDVPTSLSVVTAKDIQDKNMIAVSDLSTRLPNVQISGSSLYPQITIRGVTSQVSGGNPGFAPAAAVYVDDVYQGRDRATNLPMSGISQIEVLRGPQGTLYGKNTIAGAINISTIKPGDEFIALGDFQVGNIGFEQATGTVSGPLGDDLAASVSGVYRHRNGWIRNTFNGKGLNYDRAWGGRTRFVYTPTDKLSIDIGADYLDEDDTESSITYDYTILQGLAQLLPFAPWNSQPYYNPRSRKESLNSPEYGHRKVHGVSAKIDYDLDGVRLTSISAIRGYTSASAFDTDGTAINIDNETWVNNANQFSQEVRLTSTSEGPFQWIAGGYYYHENERSVFTLFIHDQFPTFLLSLPSLPPGYLDYSLNKSQVVENSFAGFLSATYDITSQLRLAAGIRFTEDKKTLHFSQTPLGASPISVASILLVTVPPRVEKISENEPSYDVSLTYKFTDNQVGYAKIARGYKSGGFNVWAVTPPFNPATDRLAFKPEFLTEYEAGYKANYLDGHLSLRSAVFYDNYTNKQEQEEDPLVLSIVVRNAAKARIYGAEFEVDAIPFDGLTLSGTLGLLHGTYVAFPDAGASNSCNCFDGNHVALAPDWETTLAAQYEHAIDGWDGHTVFARVEWMSQAKSYTEPSNSVRYESTPYSLLNARVGVEGDHWGLYAWGKNLANTFHSAGGSYLLIDYSKNINIPRTFGLELSLKN